MLRKFPVGFAVLLFLVSLFIGIDRFAHHRSTAFSIDKIISSHDYSHEWDLPPLSEEDSSFLNTILGQKFTYYNKGSQSYVFISEDKKYILKFFKQQKLVPKSWLAYLPLSFNPYYQDLLIKQNKCRATFHACKTAFLELKEQSGVLFVHLNPTSELHRSVTLLDKKGNLHSIDIDQTCFYIQKHAQLIYSRISELMYKDDLEGAKQIITSIFSLIRFLGEKGVVDNDPILRKNFGLINDIAVQIDIGKLRIDPMRQGTCAYKEEVTSITHSFALWLKNNYPTLTDHFEQELAAIVMTP